MVILKEMTPRHLGGWLMLVSIVVGVAGTVPRAAGITNPRELAWAPVLNLRLTVSNELPPLSRQALIKETESIWREGHLQLRWLEGSEAPEAGMNLRVLVTPRAVTSAIDGHRWAVGELIRFEGSRAIALASIMGARRVLEQTRPVGLMDLLEFQQHSLGVVLGRAVAHEIGHYVLRTNTHASYGLMRANIDAREFAELRTDTFRIDREAEAHLAARAALGPASSAGEFSYSAH